MSALVPTDESVCAVVVTYNRKDLLGKCLRALLGQTTPVAKILVVNNASTDDTLEMLAAQFSPSMFPQISVRTLPANVGGAGGFHAGVKQGAFEGYQWLWLLDDDTIVEPETLAELLAARARFERPKQPVVLASKVVWKDGTLHNMNIPLRREDDTEGAFDAAERGCLSIRAATFVSVLIHRSCVEQFGLPYAEYFIWGEDVEYTARILRDNRGVGVPRSLAVHETAVNHTAMTAEPAKFYFHVRNELWLLTRSTALRGNERAKRSMTLLRHVALYLRSRRFEGQALQAVAAAIRDAVLKRPGREA